MNNIILDDMEYIINSDIDFDKLKDKTILITGATGMLASYLVMVLLYLNNNNYNIKILALSKNKKRFNELFSNFNNDNLILLELDVTKIKEKDFDDYKIDYIIHTASPSKSYQFLSNPLNVIYCNIFATDKLLNIAKNNEIESFLYFSSCSVYGNIENGYFREDIFGGIDPLDVRSIYDGTKSMAETLCNAYKMQYNIPVKIARIAHTYGPSIDLNNDNRVFSEFVRNIINNENIIIRSNGNTIRSFCYIADATIGFLKILLHGQNGGAYNIANNNATVNIKRLAEILISIYPEKNIEIVFSKHNDSYLPAGNIDKLNNLFIDTKKLESLNWKAKYDIKTGFKRVIDYFENKKKDKNEKN